MRSGTATKDQQAAILLGVSKGRITPLQVPHPRVR
jgi:hypothetical protein